MDLIIGSILLLYCIGVLVYKSVFNIDFDVKLTSQILVSGIGSVVILGPFLYKRLKNFKFPKLGDGRMDNSLNIPFACEEHTINDFKALSYLKERAKEMNSDEALQMVIKLNTLLFSSDCNHEEKK